MLNTAIEHTIMWPIQTEKQKRSTDAYLLNVYTKPKQ